LPSVTARGGRRAIERLLGGAGRVLRLPWQVVPYLAHPVQTVRMMRNADIQRDWWMSTAFPLSAARKPWRLLVPAALVVLLLTIALPAARLVLIVVLAFEACAVAWYRWWNSSRQLRRRGLPPGRLAIPLFTSVLEDDFYRRQWNRYGPIYTTNVVYQPTVVIGGIELGRRVLREHRDELRPPVLNHAERVEGGAIRNQVGERHRASRALFAHAFAPSTVDASRPAMEDAVRRHLATWLAEGADLASSQSPIRSRLELLVLDAWITVFLGVDPRTDATLHARLVELFSRYSCYAPIRRDPVDLVQQLAIIRERSLHPDELSASVLRTLAEQVPDALDDPVVTSNLVHMLDTSRQDVAALLTWLVYRLAHHPQWCDRIRQAGADEPASWVVSETLRLSQSEHVVRETQCPVNVEGYTIPAGWGLRVLVRESHRDPNVFADPERFDPCRFGRGMPPRSEYSPFGLDAHACIGEALTRMFAIVVARELSCRCRLELTGDGQAMFYEWHWAPSSDFQVRFTAAEPTAPHSTA
jgi:cytochrome P450